MWLWEWISPSTSRLCDGESSVRLADLAQATAVQGLLEALRGRVVLITTHDQLSAALALLELDGVARRMVLCPPDLSDAHLPAVIRAAEVDACVRSEAQPNQRRLGVAQSIVVRPELRPAALERRCSHETEWVLLTSGTSGPPKLVVHTLGSLTAAFASRAATPETIAPGDTAPAGIAPRATVWSTFYDIRRYGGLQILLRALRGCELLLCSPAQSIADFLTRAAAAGVTHISGTASHWRAALMSGAAARIAPCYVRLSGEIADQAILDALRVAYPDASIAHAFASTEAGVAFEVDDGQAGFPASWVGTSTEALDNTGAAGTRATLRLVDGSLRVRSAGSGKGYLGSPSSNLKDAEGFVDTGDRVELRDGRYYFMGRSGGIINVGGLKVHPEEVEAVINSHQWVHMSLVKARRSPITGAVVTADVVLVEASAGNSRPPDADITAQIRQACQRVLAAHKVPASIRVVPALRLSAAGKLVRPDA